MLETATYILFHLLLLSTGVVFGAILTWRVWNWYKNTFR